MIYFRREVISCALISSYPLFLSQLRDHNSLDKLSKLIPMYISSHSHHNFPPSFFISKKNNGIKYIQSTDKRERKRRNRNYICARPSSSSTKMNLMIFQFEINQVNEFHLNYVFKRSSWTWWWSSTRTWNININEMKMTVNIQVHVQIQG